MKSVIVIVLLAITPCLYAQKFTTESAEVSFFSEAPLENIEAHNTESKGAFDTENGDLVFSIPIKSFTFEKSLMQEHFNENYLESEKYPDATFKGKIENFSNSSGEQEATAKGKMTIHGVTRDVEIKGVMAMKDNKILMTSKFPIKVADYKIKIPQVVFYNIAEEVEVSVEFVFVPYQSVGD